MASRALDESAVRVSDCVTELLRKQPFFGSLVLRLPLRPDPTRETLATDGHEIRYSPRWVAETEAHLIETAMARVVMACALKHHTRRGERDTVNVGSGPRRRDGRKPRLENAANRLHVEFRTSPYDEGLSTSSEVAIGEAQGFCQVEGYAATASRIRQSCKHWNALLVSEARHCKNTPASKQNY